MNEVFTLYDVNSEQDLTPYLSSFSWSGSIDEAARKIDCVLAYNTMDQAFILPNINMGDTIKLTYHTAINPQEITIFQGKAFLMQRESRSYTIEFVAYDNVIYLKKSHTSDNYKSIAARDVIKKVCSVLGVTVGDLSCKDLDTVCNFVADNLAGTEIITKALDACKAVSNADYHVYLVYDGETPKLNVVRGDTVIDYMIEDAKNETKGNHSASVEDMINQVQIVDKDGNTTGYLYNKDDRDKYGLLQGVYKIDDKKDNDTASRACLKKMSETSSVSALGDITAIAGYAVKVKEEQITGTFRIISDSHHIGNNSHTMDLTLGFLETVDDGKDATLEGNIPVSNPATEINGGGSMDIDAGLNAGVDAWLGVTMDNGANGCAEAVGKVGSYYSPFLAQESNNGVVYVPTMVNDAGDHCIPFDSSQVEKGDVIVYGDNDHVVIAAGGNGEYIGNSTSQNKVIKGGDFYEMGGLYPTKIIKTSHF